MSDRFRKNNTPHDNSNKYSRDQKYCCNLHVSSEKYDDKHKNGLQKFKYTFCLLLVLNIMFYICENNLLTEI
jgi:hypothetical protein